MTLRTLVAVALTSALVAIVPAGALAGNPKGAVNDAKKLRVLVSESKSDSLYRQVQDLVYQMHQSKTAFEKQKTKLAPAMRAALDQIPFSFGGLQAWTPESAFGSQMRRYALWLVASEHNALARGVQTLQGVEKKPASVQATLIRQAVNGFWDDVTAIGSQNNSQLAAAGQGIPADEKQAVQRFSVSG